MILRLPGSWEAVIKCVWGARRATWCVGGQLVLLLAASWRVLRAKWYYYGGDQIRSAANKFRAEINCQGMICNYEFNNLKSFWLERVSGVVQNSVVRSILLSFQIRNGFRKNQLIPSIITAIDYKCRRITGFGAFWVKIWRFVIFVG